MCCFKNAPNLARPPPPTQASPASSGSFRPGVFGVFAAEFLADAGVVVAPEGGEVGGDLNGALGRGEDVDGEGDAA